MADPDAPVGDDLRSEDYEYNPSVEPNKAKAWLNLLLESEKAFEDWNDHCDNIDRTFADIERLTRHERERQYQIFWANAEVIKPAIYAKPPVPVVVPKFKDRRPVYQQASEMMERCCTVAFDNAGIDELMKLVRDDLALIDRGVAWCRYESGNDDDGYYSDGEKVCIDFKNRRDFLHSISRNWREVGWVAAASYLTRSEARKRFRKYSGDEYQRAEYRVDKEGKEVGGADNRERAKFWEIWSKGDKRVLWVAHGCEYILDEDDPHLDLRNYFPCPKPAYGTVQRGSLVPVPDVLQYQDQLDEINLLTARIHALSDSLEVKGFYPAGGAELADAIQTAISIKTPGRVIVPISNWSTFGGNAGNPIVWLPIDQIATTITELVTLRKQIIDDIYQITGLADIMRGDTDPQETLGAQQLKTQYGTTRIRDKQQELVRLARDLVEITSEIITEKFDPVTMIKMSQTQLPTSAMQHKQVVNIQKDVADKTRALQMMQQLPQVQQAAQQNPQQAQQVMQQAQQALQQMQAAAEQSIAKIMSAPTLDQVLAFLKDNRAKSFVLDIETDSTIVADETADKAATAEFMGVLSTLLPQLSMMIQGQPKTAEFCGEILKFATKPYRAGRQLDSAIDDLTELMKQQQDQPSKPDPTTVAAQTQMQIEQMKLSYAKQKDDADRQVKIAQVQSSAQTGMAKAQTDAQTASMEIQGRQQENAAKTMQINMEAQNQEREHALAQNEMAMKAQMAAQKHAMDLEAAQHKASHMDQQLQDRRAMDQFKMTQPPANGGLP
jgi:hypothetical protein